MNNAARSTRPSRPMLALALLAAFAAPRAARAVGQEVGRIVGRVTDAAGGPLPGVVVTVTSPALIGQPRQAQTDADGRFEIANLPTGTYDLEAGYGGGGVKPAHRRLDVLPTGSTPITIAWTPETEGEEVVISSERHLTNPDSPNSGAVFDTQKYRNIPLARQYQSTLSQAPGVIGTGNANVRGSTQRQNRFLIDGLDITDMASNTFRGNWHFEAASGIEVLTGGMEAKYNAIGAVTNIITRGGSDDLHLDATFYVRPSVLQSIPISGRQSYDGLRPFADDPKPKLNDIETGLVIDGPILKKKLWFSASMRYATSSQAQPAGPPLNVQAPNRFSQLYQPRLKLIWAPTDKQRYVAQFLADPTVFDFVNNAGGQANTTEPLAAFTQTQGGKHAMLEWDYYATVDTDVKILAGYQHSAINAGAQGYVRGLDPKYGVYDFNQPQHVNRRDGSVWGNQLVANDDTRRKFQLDGSVTTRGRFFGLHEAEAGFQGFFSRYTVRNTPTGNGVSYVDDGGPPLKAGLCDDDPYVRAGGASGPVTGVGCFQKIQRVGYGTAANGFTFGVYLQDRWKPTSWLTVLPGLRWDRYDFRLRGADTGYGNRALLYGFGPRLSIIGDLTGDQKTIAQVSYGRATQGVYAQVLTGVDIANKNPVVISTWNPATKKFDLRPPVTNGGPGGAFFDTNNHRPAHSDELFFRLSREVFTNSVASVEVSVKRVSNIVDQLEVNRIYDPSGSRVVGYRNPATPSAVLLTTYPDASYTNYRGVSFIFEAKPASNVDFQGSYTLSWTYGPNFEDLPLQSSGFSQYANPRQSNLFSGYALDIDTRHSLKTATSYTYKDAIVGLLFNWNSGVASLKQFNPASSELPPVLRSPIGTEPGAPANDYRSWTEFRTPDFFNVGVTLAYDLKTVTTQHIVITGEATNLLNLTTPATFNRLDNDAFGTVSSRQTGRRIQVGARYTF